MGLCVAICRFVVVFIDGRKDVSFVAQELHCLSVERKKKEKKLVPMFFEVLFCNFWLSSVTPNLKNKIATSYVSLWCSDLISGFANKIGNNINHLLFFQSPGTCCDMSSTILTRKTFLESFVVAPLLSIVYFYTWSYLFYGDICILANKVRFSFRFENSFSSRAYDDKHFASLKLLTRAKRPQSASKNVCKKLKQDLM